MRSVVVALMLTRERGRPSTSAVRARIASRCGPILGRSHSSVTSTCAIRAPASFASFSAWRRNFSEVRAFPLRIAGREVRADVAFAERAEDSVHQRVPARVRIGMADEALVVRDPHAAERHMIARPEAVRVEPRADARAARAKHRFKHRGILRIGELHQARIAGDQDGVHALRRAPLRDRRRTMRHQRQRHTPRVIAA